MRKHIFTLKKQYLDSAACSNVLNVKKSTGNIRIGKGTAALALDGLGS